MKIDLKKFRNGVSKVVRKQISFLCCEFFLNNLFIKQYLTLHYNKIYNNRPANKKGAKQ